MLQVAALPCRLRPYGFQCEAINGETLLLTEDITTNVMLTQPRRKHP